jgi:DNA-binding Xre family transcriptional regulator
MSTSKLKTKSQYVITSNLGKLLAERNLTQKELARITGVSERAISVIKNRKVVRLIDCDSAVKICLALSGRMVAKKRRKNSIRLDALFPIKVAGVLR